MTGEKQFKNETYITRLVNGKPEAMYDIGVGPKTEWVSIPSVYPGMSVFGCEPNPSEYERLVKMFPGPLANVAIGEEEGTAKLHLQEGDPKVASMFKMSYCNREAEIKVWTLDRFDEQMGSPNCILLWIDIEGMELQALRSGPKLLKSGRVRWINLEERLEGKAVVPGWTNPRDLQHFLEQNGYRRICDYNRHVTHQDVIYFHHGESTRIRV